MYRATGVDVRCAGKQIVYIGGTADDTRKTRKRTPLF